MANRHLSRSIVLQTLFEWDFMSTEEKDNVWNDKKIKEALKRNLKEFAPGLEDDIFVFSLVEEVNDRLLKVVTVARSGEAKVKRADLRKVLDDAFQAGAKAAASGERVRFPIIGALVRKDVKPRKAGKGFTAR